MIKSIVIYNFIETILKFIIKLYKIPLQRYYKFDKWHICSLKERKYALSIINKITSLKDVNSIIEIGCGLGEIIRNCRAETKICLDLDRNVLRANKFLSYFRNKANKNIEFREFDIFTDRLEYRTDIVIMVNWIHNVHEKVLKEKIYEIFVNNINPGGGIFLDTVANATYKYNHNIKSIFADLNCTLELTGVYEYGRSVYWIKKPEIK